MDAELREARRLAELYRKLRTSGSTLESTARSEPVKTAEVKKALQGRLAAAEAGVGAHQALESAAASPVAAIGAADVMAAADRALQKVEGRDEAALTDLELAALEAIVQVVGRPAVRYTNNRVQMPNNEGENSHWRTIVATARSEINAVSAAVGRVAIAHDNNAGQVIGTAWRTGPDLSVTNRHVAKYLVADPTAARSAWKLDPAKPSVVDFNVTDDAAKTVRFPIAELVYCPEDEDVDLAILRLDRRNGTLPEALDLDWDPGSIGGEVEGAFRGEEIYIVGHPYRPFGGNAVSRVFGKADGYKRWSPGRVTTPASPRPVFEHDCSTLGGNSGSCVVSVQGHSVVGLHYAGLGVDILTDIGKSNAALALSRLRDARAVDILKKGHA